MLFEEVLPALREGKKIGRKKWNKGYYYEMTYKYGNNVIVDNHGEAKEDWEDLLATDWEIVKETKKVKLRDLTYEQFKKWQCKNCDSSNCFTNCPFGVSGCRSNFRILHKDMFSDKFLDQEIEIEE